MSTQNPRLLALQVLIAVFIRHQALDDALAKINSTELNLIKFLSYGVIREYQSLEFLLNTLLNKPLKAKEFELKLILLLGLLQLKNSRIPEHAAINETVNLAKLAGYDYASNLVNAILRRFTREREALLNKLQTQFISEHPEWLFNTIKQTYPQHWQDIIKANNTQAPMHLRVNRKKTSRDAYLKILAQQELFGQAVLDFPDAITLEEAVDVQRLPHFEQGWISVQDLAPQLTPYLLDLQAGQNVLDACAAPGGKTCHILEYSEVNLISMDIAKPRLQLIKDNLTRLGLNAEVRLGDASQTQSSDALFERILIDAPCSGTGVIRRHPDIKFLRRETDIQKLHELQVNIIKQMSQYLKPNGLLLYATCSILTEENDLSIDAALSKLPELEPIDFADKIPKAITSIKTKYGIQLLPSTTKNDGFYYAILKKK